MIIIGSTALEKFNLNRRQPKDIDCFYSEKENVDKSIKTDYHVVPDNIYDLLQYEMIDGKNYATPDCIFTLKLSHFSWDIHWEKTKNDILWLKYHGCKLLPELYHDLKNHWINEHGNKDFLSLNKSKKEFFTDKVKYYYDHDYLHELVAYPNEPVYKKCLKGEVLIDKSKFDMLSYEDQLRMFREEITVIACERWLLQKNNNISWYESYLLALKKTIINLTKNWASDFIIFNLDKFVKPDYNYFRNLIKVLEIDMAEVDLSIFEEIKEKYELDCEVYKIVYDFCSGDFDNTGEKSDEIEADYGYEHLEQEGGGEGGSEYCYGVFKLKDKIYKAEYRYYSHYGFELDDILDTLKEVKPVQRMVTFYE